MILAQAIKNTYWLHCGMVHQDGMHTALGIVILLILIISFSGFCLFKFTR